MVGAGGGAGRASRAGADDAGRRPRAMWMCGHGDADVADVGDAVMNAHGTRGRATPLVAAGRKKGGLGRSGGRSGYTDVGWDGSGGLVDMKW